MSCKAEGGQGTVVMFLNNGSIKKLVRYKTDPPSPRPLLRDIKTIEV